MRNGNEMVAEPLPPETTTPMPPTLHFAYDRALGWPGRPEDRPADEPKRTYVMPKQVLRERGRSRR